MHNRVAFLLNNATKPYTLHSHSSYGVIKSPEDFAACLGYDLARITKTLLLTAKAEGLYFLAVAPTTAKLDLKALAQSIGLKRLSLATAEELSRELDYPPTGVSPLAAGSTRVFIDSSLFDHESILIGSGVIGQEIELSPEDLKQLTVAAVQRLTA